LRIEDLLLFDCSLLQASLSPLPPVESFGTIESGLAAACTTLTQRERSSWRTTPVRCVRACVRACMPRRVHDDAQVCMIHIWSSAALRLMAPLGDPLSICFLFVPSLSWQITIAREKHPGEQDPHIVCACVRVLLPLLYSHYCRASPWVASGAISQTITSGLAIHSISTWAGTAYSMSGAATER
jgi:hypothetical protein